MEGEKGAREEALEGKTLRQAAQRGFNGSRRAEGNCGMEDKCEVNPVEGQNLRRNGET